MSLLPTDTDLLDILSTEAKEALLLLATEKETEKDRKLTNNGDFITEDFGYSQFWYDNNTSNMLANEAITGSNESNIIANSTLQNKSNIILNLPTSGSICCLMAPSAFKSLKLLDSLNRMVLFEYDKRFGELYNNQFSFYDVNYPLAIDAEYLNSFDFIIADPPYLNKDTVDRTMQTIKALSRDINTKIIFNTGAIMEENLLPYGVRKIVFEPHHASNLSNIFYSFANYDAERLGGFDKPIESVRPEMLEK